MNGAGQNKVKLFAENSQIIIKEFVWQGAQIKRMAALLYAQKGKTIDPEAIRKCLTLIKQNTGVFSTFRGDMALCVATLLSLSPNPQEALSNALKVYGMLKGKGFHISDFLVVAAYQIAAHSDASDYERITARTKDFYDGMKARHFFSTGEDDYIFAAMLALTDLDARAGTERIEQLYSRLNGEFWDKNSVQTLAQVLALGNSDDRIANRVLELRNALREQKIKLDKAYTLPVLGVLALLPVEIDTIVRDINAARDFLKAQKGFGGLSVTPQELLLFAASIAAAQYADNIKDGVLTATLSTSIANIIIAQQTTMIALCYTFALAAQTSSSSPSS